MILTTFTGYNKWCWLNAGWFFAGLFVLGWSPEVVVFAYIFETSIIGIITIVKMLIIGFRSTKNKAEVEEAVGNSFSEHEVSILRNSSLDSFAFILYNAFVICMFVVVFFGFIWGQSIFAFLMASYNNPDIFNGPNRLGSNLRYLFSLTEMKQAFAGIILVHLINLWQQFIVNKEYQRLTMQQIFVQPWIGIFIQQLVVIIGGFIFFGSGKSFVMIAVALVIIKTTIDTLLLKTVEKRSIRNIGADEYII